MTRKNKVQPPNADRFNLLGQHRSAGHTVVLCSIHLLIGQSAGNSGICARGISAATAHYSRDRQTPWRDNPRRSWLGQTQRVGLCGIHIRVDLGICCALSCERWPDSIRAADIAAAPRHLLRDPATKSAVAGKSHRRVNLARNHGSCVRCSIRGANDGPGSIGNQTSMIGLCQL
jgi:hypothetical protein